MPKIDRKLISIKSDIIADLKKIVKIENVLDHEDETRPLKQMHYRRISKNH